MYKNALLAQLYAAPLAFDASALKSSKILVTGAGGSIGSVLCQKLASLDPDLLVMLDSYDGNLYHLERKMTSSPKHLYQVGDIRDLACLMAIVRRWRFDFVFHAAALKHVPMLEDPLNMLEAARTNVLGTLNTIRATSDLTDAVLVNVSTDKAVYPSSILGLTKRCAELYVRQYAETWNYKYTSVRFGNVLDSVGSVIPLFKHQIEQGGPITVTDFRMCRYFMTAERAASLIVQAALTQMNSMGYRLFTPLLGDQIGIVELAQALMDEAGKTVNIIETGVRRGEKHRETMRYDYEMVGRSNWTDVNELLDTSKSVAMCDMLNLAEMVEHRTANLIARLMRKMVPEYTGDFTA